MISSRTPFHTAPHHSPVAEISSFLPFFIVRGHIHTIINSYRVWGVECVLRFSNKVLKQFLQSGGPGDCHFDHLPLFYGPSTGSVTESLPAYFVILGHPPDENIFKQPSLGELHVECVIRCSLARLESFLYERRTSGDLNIISSGGIGKASQYFASYLDRIIKDPDTIYIQWPAISPVSASTTRILKGPRSRKRKPSELEHDDHDASL